MATAAVVNAAVGTRVVSASAGSGSGTWGMWGVSGVWGVHETSGAATATGRQPWCVTFCSRLPPSAASPRARQRWRHRLDRCACASRPRRERWYRPALWRRAASRARRRHARPQYRLPRSQRLHSTTCKRQRTHRNSRPGASIRTPVKNRRCSAGRKRPSDATLTRHRLHRHGVGRGTVVRLPGEIGRCRAHLRHQRCCIPSADPCDRRTAQVPKSPSIQATCVGIAPTPSAAPARPPCRAAGQGLSLHLNSRSSQDQNRHLTTE